jgi:CDP-paratose 2-epimerase
MLEAIDIYQRIVERELKWTYSEHNRIGDPIGWLSDNSKLANHYPNWKLQYNVPLILQEIYEFNKERWQKEAIL